MRVFAAFGIAASVLVIVLYGLVHGDWLQAVLGGIALGMSMLPEEFPLVLTAFMVMGAWRLSRARVLTRRAAAIEMLGAATVLCTDKTGTLTENRMTVAELRSPAAQWRRSETGAVPDVLAHLLEIAMLASAPQPSEPMEKALAELVALRPGGLALFMRARRMVRRYGLRPDLLAMTNVWSRQDNRSGAPWRRGRPRRLPAFAVSMKWRCPGFARRPMRWREMACVFSVSARPARVTASFLNRQTSFAFRFVGLVGFADPLRANVPDAVAECRSANVRVIMITGDYRATAQAIAGRAGLEAGSVMEGASWRGSTRPRSGSACDPPMSLPASCPSRSCASSRR